MTEIIIDKIQTEFLIKKLREIFKPYIISEHNETVLNFNNEVGEGTFSIVTLENDKLNIYFKGKLNQLLEIKFYNAKQPALNFIYLQRGNIHIKHGEAETCLIEGAAQQLIYSSTIKEEEIVSWPAEVEVEFNFLKVFDFPYLNSKLGELSSDIIFDDIINATEKPFTDIRAEKSSAILENESLLNSDLVGEARIKDLEQKIKNIFNVQLKELF